MRETREKVEKKKRESLAAVHTSSFNKQIKNEVAITLVALVVTIIVLILLAGVSISLVIGNNGIMQKAAKGREDYTGATINEQQDLNKIEDYIEDNTSNAVKIESVKGGNYFEAPTTVKDTNGNVLAKGRPILQQDAANYTQEVIISSYWKELAISREGTVDYSNRLNDTNTTALNLKGFVDSVKANGGYYIARYEASYGTDGKANSKVSNTYAVSTPNKEGQLWNCISQINAATASRNLYTGVKSDLINSYVWDTAIVYIQNFSGDTDYSKQDSLNKSLANTGVNSDGKCKINDMASNTSEWTTEYCTYTGSSIANPCTSRGGNYGNSSRYTDNRNSNNATNGDNHISFRCALYM